MHALGLAAMVLLCLALVYVSRFWIWTLWDPSGLLGLKFLSPYGDLVRHQLDGTALADYHWLVWGCGGILTLSILQRLASKVSR
jgi:hypothetical protein